MVRHLFHAGCPAALLALLPLLACEPLPDPDPSAPDGVDAVVADSPQAPTDEAGAKLGWAGAPLMQGVKVVANHDSAVLIVPSIDAATDYRAFRVPAGTRIDAGLLGDEDVIGTVVHCAGNRQHNNPQ